MRKLWLDPAEAAGVWHRAPVPPSSVLPQLLALLVPQWSQGPGAPGEGVATGLVIFWRWGGKQQRQGEKKVLIPHLFVVLGMDVVRCAGEGLASGGYQDTETPLLL